MRKSFNPLDRIPSPEVIRGELREAEQTAERLRILLRVSEEIAAVTTTTDSTAKAGEKASA
jgi:hypothetical protein